MNERNSPEILDYQEDAVKALKQKLEAQVSSSCLTLTDADVNYTARG